MVRCMFDVLWFLRCRVEATGAGKFDETARNGKNRSYKLMKRVVGTWGSRSLATLAGKYGENLSPLATFRAAVAAGDLNEDPRQFAALVHLEQLFVELKTFKRPPPIPPPPVTKRGTLPMVTC